MAYRSTALLLLTLISAAGPPEDYGEPYRILQEANLKLDAALAASAYASDGAIIFDYPGRPVETFRGLDAIRSSYVRTFGQVDPDTPINVEFRFDPPGPNPHPHSGAYRVRAKAAGRAVTAYGRFKVKLIKQDGRWRFAEDRGTPATADDFERLPQ